MNSVEGFGVSKADLVYDGPLDWFLNSQDPFELYKAQKSYILSQAVYLFGAVFALIHSFRQGGRWPYLYFAAIGHGIVVELISYFFPSVDNFWHSQTPINFIGQRLPLYIVFLYPVFYYHANWACMKLKLTCPWAQHLAIGLLVVLIDLPYDIVGIKFLHWTWHDTDPNIYERHYWVPWNSYYFHATFAASFSFIFHNSRKLMESKTLGKWEAGKIASEIISMIITSIFANAGGVLLFLPLYHPFHDMLNVPTEVTTISLFVVFIVIVWKFDRKSSRSSPNNKAEKLDFVSVMLLLHLVAHYFVYLGTVIFLNPEDNVSIGIHEPIGDCNAKSPVHTILKTLEKRTYLCVEDYDEKYFSFDCLPKNKIPENGSTWYTICGTPFENRAEYILIISIITFAAAIIFTTIHFDNTSKLKVNPDQKMKQK